MPSSIALRVGAGRLAALLAAFLSACAGMPPEVGESSGGRRPYLGPDTIMGMRAGTVALHVREGAPAKANAVPDAEIAKIAGQGAGMAPLGFLMGPMFGGAVVFGGAFVAMLGGGLYAYQSSQVRGVRDTLASIDFARLLDEALRRRAIVADGPPGPVARAEVLVTAWGIVTPTRRADERHCFVVEVGLTIERDAGQPETVPFRIMPGTDPPPQCADLDAFLGNRGRLAHETARDYAELLAALVAGHLRSLP